MEARRTEEGALRLGGNARERFYDARGYGSPDGDGLVLAPVEAAHLLYRGDIDAIAGDSLYSFLAEMPGLPGRFLVYKDLRDRGFYLAPASRWLDEPTSCDLVVFPRGQGPWGEQVESKIAVVGERDTVRVGRLGDRTLARVDEESGISYLDSSPTPIEGATGVELPAAIPAMLFGDRALVPDAPPALHQEGFYGQPLDERDRPALQLSLLEACYLAEGPLALAPELVTQRGREVEGERFERRLQVYTTLRTAGVVPKTGFKFGADFRTYAEVDSVDSLGHSELLVRVVTTDHVFSPRDLSLDVRLAHGVRKRMVYALAGERTRFVALERLTP